MEDFKNRESQYINRRKLTIVSQTPTELVVDITRNEGEIEVAGSPIDATTMNAFNTQINSAVNNASAALLKANEVETTANSAKSIAETASADASSAVTTANTADTNVLSNARTAIYWF